MLLKQPRFTYSACGSFTRNKGFNNLYKQEIRVILIDTIQIKPVFKMIGHMLAIKDLFKRTESDKVLRDKAFKVASYPKHYGYERGLAS